MYKLLIVDDERHIVDWLYEMFTCESGLELEICKAYSGHEALKWLERTKIDIVLTDIRMPGISGLELVEKIYGNWPYCKVIFLTGFSEFDYIYSAIKHEGVSYLLKTEDDEEIIHSVERAIDSIEEDLKNVELHNKIKLHEEDLMRIEQNEFFLDFLSDVVPFSEEAAKELESLNVSLDTEQPVILLLGRLDNRFQKSEYAERSNYSLALSFLMDKYMSDIVNSFQVDCKNEYFVWIMQYKKSKSQSGNSSYREFSCEKTLLYIRETLETVQAACKESIGEAVSFLLSNEPVQWCNIAEKFSYLQFLFNQSIGFEQGVLLNESNLKNFEAKQIFPQNFDFKQVYLNMKKVGLLENYLERGQEQEYFETLSVFTNCLCNVKSLHYMPAVEMFLSLSLMLLSYINHQQLVEKLSFKVALNKLVHIELFESWKDVADYLYILSQKIFEMQKIEHESRHEDIIRNIRKFVSENLSGDLSLVSIAEVINYNTSYISRLFKQVTGVNLFDYINDARIKKAKELLETCNMNIYNVAKAVGYDSPQYFATAFKKAINMTPQEYRDNASSCQ